MDWFIKSKDCNWGEHVQEKLDFVASNYGGLLLLSQKDPPLLGRLGLKPHTSRGVSIELCLKQFIGWPILGYTSALGIAWEETHSCLPKYAEYPISNINAVISNANCVETSIWNHNPRFIIHNVFFIVVLVIHADQQTQMLLCQKKVIVSNPQHYHQSRTI